MLRLCLCCACGLAAPLMADVLTLDGGERLTGTLRSINEAGVVEVASELSPTPVMLRKDAVNKVAFNSNIDTPKPPPALLELVNGDLLPVIIDALDDRKLTVVSPQAGRLEIPRESLKSLQLGIQPRKQIYAGPRNLEEWTSGENTAKNWVFEDNSLIANGAAVASMKVALPQQFVLRFTLKWQPPQMPNFQIFFADPLKAKGEESDRYYLQYGGAGLEIKREATAAKRQATKSKCSHFNTLMLLPRLPNQYPNHQLEVELRIDRKGSRGRLFLNGEPEGEFADPITGAPDGSGIVLVCNPQNGSPQQIQDIEVCEFDDSRSRHHTEERGDPNSDSLISRDEDRWGGQLMEILKTGDEQIFRFKSNFQKDPLEIPAVDVSTVFFTTKNSKPPEKSATPYVLRLGGDGALQLSSCLVSEDTVAAVHPLLGKLNLRRDGIQSLERATPKPKTSPKSAPGDTPKP